MRTTLLRRLSTAAVLFAALAALPARAEEGFSTANIQFLQGWNYHDKNTNTSNGQVSTVTFNYFTTWAYGDMNFFVDFARAQAHFVDTFSGAAKTPIGDSLVYGEIQPRIGLGKTFGWKCPLGLFRDFGPAFELNQGNNFYAYLAGFGGDFNLPQPYVAGLNLYYRYDKFYGDGWQATTYWGIPFSVGPVGFALAGFADFSKALTSHNSQSIDIISQPELLVDVGALWNQPRRWWVGAEWNLHYNPVKSDQSLQAMVQYTIR